MPKKLKKTKSQYDVGFETGHRVGYNEAYDIGQLEGFRIYCVSMLYGMKDALKMSDEDIKKIHLTIKDYVEMIRTGNISLEQMERSLKHAFNFEFIWTE